MRIPGTDETEVAQLPPKNTASLYKRLSEKPDETSTSLESQEQDMRRLAAERGLTVVAVHEDPGFPARYAIVPAS